MSKPAAAFFLIATCSVLCRQLHADTINQSQSTGSITIGFFAPIGQTFQWTTDPGLGSIGFNFGTANPGQPNAPVTVSLYAGAGFTGSVLGSVTQLLPLLPSPNNPGVPIDFDFSGILLAPGTYTAALTTTSTRLGVRFTHEDPYAEGALIYTGGPLAACTSGGTCDLQFRITPASVAEPTSIGTLLVGLMLLSMVLPKTASRLFEVR